MPVVRSFIQSRMLENTQRKMKCPLDNISSGCKTNMAEYPKFEDSDIVGEISFFDVSSASEFKLANLETEKEAHLAESELSQDLYTLIDSFNLEGPIQNFGSSDSETFQSVINDVIDAAPSGDEFNFLDNVCGFSTTDVPVKNNSSSVTGTACVYTCAAEKDRCANQITCARTSSTTMRNNNTFSDTVETLTAAEHELLDKLPGFLENIDTVITSRSSSNSKRGRDLEPQDLESKKKIRLDNSRELLSNFQDSTKDSDKLSREYTCARGS